MTEPAADSVPAPARYPAPDTASAREVFVAWEKLRVIYNAVLVAIVVTSATFGGTKFDAGFVGFLLGTAVAANVVYCACPVAEGYAALVGVPRRACRIVLFTLGLLVGGCLTFAATFSFGIKVG